MNTNEIIEMIKEIESPLKKLLFIVVVAGFSLRFVAA
jgi:hypothetical protein